MDDRPEHPRPAPECGPPTHVTDRHSAGRSKVSVVCGCHIVETLVAWASGRAKAGHHSLNEGRGNDVAPGDDRHRNPTMHHDSRPSPTITRKTARRRPRPVALAGRAAP